MKRNKPIPVILDTDIGTDIDDTWALAMALRCPELNLKLVTTCTGDTLYRAKLAARFLELSGNAGVEVGVGLPTRMEPKHITQGPWVKEYDLGRYPGKVHADGVDALVRAVMGSPEKVTLICIGPLTNIGAALTREPRIAERARFVGMHGSMAWSHHPGHEPIAEYNVKADIPACRKVFAAGWDKTITPLDTCGRVRLSGEKYKRVAESKDPLARLIMENYRLWQESGGWVKDTDKSSILFDCVAVHLAYSEDFLGMEQLGCNITDEGFMKPDEAAPAVHCAMDWTDPAAFEDLIVKRITTR